MSLARVVWLIAVAILCPAFAQEHHGAEEESAEYAVRITNGQFIASMPSQTWKVRTAQGGKGIEVDFGNDNIQIHNGELSIYADDDDTFVIENFNPHPQIAQARGMKKWTGFAELWKREDGKHPVVIERWPVFYRLNEQGETTTFVADHFRSGGIRIIWRRVYHRMNFFLPGAVIKEVYSVPGSTMAEYVITYRRME